LVLLGPHVCDDRANPPRLPGSHRDRTTHDPVPIDRVTVLGSSKHLKSRFAICANTLRPFPGCSQSTPPKHAKSSPERVIRTSSLAASCHFSYSPGAQTLSSAPRDCTESTGPCRSLRLAIGVARRKSEKVSSRRVSVLSWTSRSLPSGLVGWRPFPTMQTSEAVECVSALALPSKARFDMIASLLMARCATRASTPKSSENRSLVGA
jgi:hypothetical protein